MLTIKTLIGVLAVAIITPATAADKPVLPQNIISQLPIGWHVIDQKKGDLNKDKVTDYALVIEKNTPELHFVTRFSTYDDPPYINLNDVDEWESQAAPRNLMAFVGLENGAFEQTLRHSDWVGRGDFGGMLGDSYDGIEIDRGSIIMKGFGGSRHKWLRTMRIRYQENKWRLIGLTEYLVDGRTLKSQNYDMNLLTYKINIQLVKEGREVNNYWDEIADKTKIYLTNIK